MTKPVELTDSVIDQMLAGIDDSKLDDEWNQQFMTNIREWWKKSRKLSDKQKRRLRELWEGQNVPKPKKPSA